MTRACLLFALQWVSFPAEVHYWRFFKKQRFNLKLLFYHHKPRNRMPVQLLLCVLTVTVKKKWKIAPIIIFESTMKQTIFVAVKSGCPYLSSKCVRGLTQDSCILISASTFCTLMDSYSNLGQSSGDNWGKRDCEFCTRLVHYLNQFFTQSQCQWGQTVFTWWHIRNGNHPNRKTGFHFVSDENS